MKNKISLLLCVFLFSISTFAQSVFTGKVTEIIDGRTAIFTTVQGTRIIVLLSNIEVPEPEQQLSSVAKQHFENLALNKNARFVVGYEYSKGYTGKLFINDFEINKQMIRDGAAWYNSPENQNSFDRNDYLELERLAKTEKRGVWGITGLKPAWEFRDEKYNKEIETKNLERKKATEKAMANRTTDVVAWAKIPDAKPVESESEDSNSGSVFDPNGKLSTEYDVFTDKGFVSTPVIILQTTGSRKLFTVQYHFTGNKIQKGGNQFLVAIAGNVDYDDEVIFLTGKGERFNVGVGQGTGSKSAVYTYKIDRNSLIKMVNSKKVFVKIGVSEAVLDDAFLNAINRLLWATK